MTRHIILTGAPGAGKTVLLRQLEQQGSAVVEEAATAVIALRQAQGVGEPWLAPAFIADITDLQCRRQAAAQQLRAPLVFHDRSLFCTLALAEFLGHPVPQELRAAVERTLAQELFARQVFFVRLLGFITTTEARRIGLEEAQAFERVHEASYRRHGFQLVPVFPGSVEERAAAVTATAETFASSSPAA